MAQQKSIKADWLSVRWEGTRSLVLHQKVVDGPASVIDRELSIRLSFDQIRHLVGHMEEAEKKLAISDKRTADINARNQGDLE